MKKHVADAIRFLQQLNSRDRDEVRKWIGKNPGLPPSPFVTQPNEYTIISTKLLEAVMACATIALSDKTASATTAITDIIKRRAQVDNVTCAERDSFIFETIEKQLAEGSKRRNWKAVCAKVKSAGFGPIKSKAAQVAYRREKARRSGEASRAVDRIPDPAELQADAEDAKNAIATIMKIASDFGIRSDKLPLAPGVTVQI